MLPLALDLSGRDVLVIGAGAIGSRRAAQLIEAGADVRVIATEVSAELPSSLVSLEVRPYRPGDLEGSFLVVSATGDPDVNDAVVAEAADRRIWLNVVDDPQRSSFFFTALHRAGDVVVSVSTEGAAPALAQVLRDRLAAALPERTAEVAGVLRAERRSMKEAGASTEDVDWRGHIDELLDGSALD
jgi:siroheme synthase-like protein